MGARNCITLIELREHEHIKTLAIDALHRRLFYAIVKKHEFTLPESTIFARNLDGSELKVVSKDSFVIPSITCDYYTERLYYVSLDTKTIWSVKYDGTGKKLMIARNEFITRPIEINLIESYAYVSNDGSKIVAKCQLYGDRQCTGIQLNVNQPNNLVIAQKSRQKSGENACADTKCTTICTPTADGPKCICDYGLTVQPGVECISKVSTNRNREREGEFSLSLHVSNNYNICMPVNKSLCFWLFDLYSHAFVCFYPCSLPVFVYFYTDATNIRCACCRRLSDHSFRYAAHNHCHNRCCYGWTFCI